MPEDWEKYAVKKTEEKQPSDEWEQFAVKKKDDTNSKNTTTNGVSLNSTSSSNSKSSNSNGYLGFPFFNILDPTNKFGNNKFMPIDENKKQAAKQMLGTPTTVPEQQKKQTVQTLEGKQKQEKSDILKKITGKDISYEEVERLTNPANTNYSEILYFQKEKPKIDNTYYMSQYEKDENIAKQTKQQNSDFKIKNKKTAVQLASDKNPIQLKETADKAFDFDNKRIEQSQNTSIPVSKRFDVPDKDTPYKPFSEYVSVGELANTDYNELYNFKAKEDGKIEQLKYQEEKGKQAVDYAFDNEQRAISTKQSMLKQKYDKADKSLTEKYGEDWMQRTNEIPQDDEDLGIILTAQNALKDNFEVSQNLINSDKYKDLALKLKQQAERQVQIDKDAKEDTWYKFKDEIHKLDNISAHIGLGLINDIASLPRLISGIVSNDYGWTDKLSDKVQLFTDAQLAYYNIPTDLQREDWQNYVEVDGYRVFVDKKGNAQSVRDKNNFMVNDSKVSESITNKYNDNKDNFKVQTDYFDGEKILNGTSKVLGDMLVMTLEAGGAGAAIKGAGKFSKSSRLLSLAENEKFLTTLAITAQTQNELFNDAINKGMSKEDATKYSFSSSLGIGLVSLINPMEANFLRNLKGVSSSNVPMFLSGNMNLRDLAKSTTLKTIENTIPEVFEEHVGEPIVQNIVNNYFQNDIAEDEELDKTDILGKENLSQVIYTAFTSFVPSALSATKEFSSNNSKLQVLENPENWLKVLEKRKDLGLITDDFYKQEVSTMESAKKKYDVLKNEVSKDNKIPLVGLITEKIQLEEKIKIAPELKDKYEKQIEDIDNKIKLLSETKTTNETTDTRTGIAVAKESSSIIGKTDTELANKITKGGIESLTPEEKDYYTAQKENIDKLVVGNIKKTTTEEVANPSVEEAKEEAPKQESGRKSLDEIFKPKTEEKKATIESAVIEIGGKMYEGKNHAEAILKAKADGQDISKVDRQAEGKFKLSDGSIIDRAEAKKQFGQDRSELIIPQDEAAKQANKDYAEITKGLKNEQTNQNTPEQQDNGNSTGMAGSEQNSKAVRTKSEQGKLSNEDKIQQNATTEVQKQITEVEKIISELEDNPNSPFHKLVNLDEQKQKLSELQKKEAEVKKESAQPVLPETKAQKAANPRLSETPKEEVEGVSGSALKDVESTAKALDADKIKQIEEITGIDADPSMFNEGTTPEQYVASMYHLSKADGSNPELVKAVEDLLGKAPTQYTEAATPAKKESGGVSGSALKDVESTAKALEGVDELKSEKGFSFVGNKKLKGEKHKGLNFDELINRLATDFFGTYGVAKSKSTIESEIDALERLLMRPDTFKYEPKKAKPFEEQLKLLESYRDKGIKNVRDMLISEAYHKAKSDGSNPELVKAVEELLTPSINEKANDKKPDTERTKEEPKVSPADTKVEQPKKGFTESKDLNKMFADLKSKYGDKKGSALYEAANRLVNPNENTIAEIRSNGVVVKEGDKYTLKPFGNTDASPNKWTLYKGLDVTDQFQKSVEQQPIVDSNSEVDALKDVESTAKALDGKTEGLLPKPSDEMRIEDLKNKKFSTFIYNKESDVPEIFKDKITSKGTTNGKTEIRVTLPKSEADYYLNKDNPQSISEAYHKAKADGSNPELVKAVEDLLGKANTNVTTPTKEVSTSENKIKSWIDKWEELKKENDNEQLDLFYNKVKVALNGYAQGKGVVDEFTKLKSEIEQFAKERKAKTKEQGVKDAVQPSVDAVGQGNAEGKPADVENPALKDVESTAKALIAAQPTDRNAIYYHASEGNDIIFPSTEGYKKREGNNVVIEGVYFGKDEQHLLDRYGVNSIKVILVLNNPLITDNIYTDIDGKVIDYRSLSKEDIEYLKTKGYDSVQYKSADKSYKSWDETVVFDKKQVYKIKEASRAYHKAKADGSNPELVKAVEEALTPQTENTKTNEEQSANADKVKTPENVAEISPNKNVSASKASAIKDLLADKYSDLKEMEAGVLANLDGTESIDDLMEYVDWNRTTQKGGVYKGKGLKGSNIVKLIEKGYVEELSFMDENITLTDKGKKFQEALKARQETRKGIKEGTDLFPNDANLQSTDKTFTTIPQKAFDKLVEKLKKVFPNVKVEFFGKNDFENAKKELEKNGIKIQDIQTKDGTIYGFKTPDGKVFLNSDNLNANTPIHEYGHIWQSVFPQGFARGIELLKLSPQGQKLIAEIQKNPAYKGKSLAEIQAEALVTAIGNKGETIFNSNPSLYKKFIEWLGDFFKTIGDKLGLDTLSADDKLNMFTKKAVGELLSGKELSKSVGKNDNVDFQVKQEYQQIVEDAAENGYSVDEIIDYVKSKGLEYDEADIRDTWNFYNNKNVTPPPINNETQIETSDGKIRDKALVNKAYNGETRSEVKQALEDIGLTYEVENQKELIAKVNDLIEKFGIDAMYEETKNKTDKNATDAIIFDAKIRSVEQKMLNATPEEFTELAQEQARLYDEMGAVGKDMGRYLSMLNYIYKTSDLAYSYERQVELYKKTNGGEISVKTELEFKELSDKLKEAQEKINTLLDEQKAIEEKYKDTVQQKEVDDLLKAEYERGKKDGSANKEVKKNKIRIEKANAKIAQGMQDFLQAIGGLKMAEGNVMPSVTKALKLIGEGLIDKGIATAENVFDKIVEHITNSTGKKPDIENYRGEFEKKEEKKAKISRKRVKQAIENGAVTVDDVVQDIQKDFPDMTEREIKEDITNYGKTKESSQLPDDVSTRKVIRMAKYDLILEDIENGKRPPRTGLQRDNLDVEERAKLKEIREGLKTLPLSDEDLSKKLKTAQDAIEARLRNRIEDLKRQIDAGKKDTRIIKPISTPDIEKLRDEVKKLEDDLDEVVSKNRHSDTLRELKDNAEISGNTTISKADVDNGLIADLVQAHIEKGTPINEIQKTMFDELKAIFPDITESGLRDAILKKGEYKSEPKEISELKKQTAELKKQLNLQEKIERTQQGIVEVAKKKGEFSEEVVALKKQLKQEKEEARNKFPEVSANELKNKIERVKKSIEEIKRKTLAEEFENKKVIAKQFRNDPNWKKANDDLRQIQIEKIKAQEAFDKKQEQARMKNRSLAEKLKDLTLDVLGLPKATVATLDLSAPLRQGIGLGVSNPKEFAGAFIAMHKMLFAKKYDEWIGRLKSSDDFYIIAESGLAITNPNGKAQAREDVFMNNLAKKIPIYGTLYNASERAYSGFLNKLRVDVFTKGVRNLELQGITFEENPEAYKSLARVINNATGRGELWGAEKVARELGLVFFSPRMITSRVGMLTDLVRKDTPKTVRAMAIKNIVGTTAYILSIHALMALALSKAGDDDDDLKYKEYMEKVNLNPIETDFLKSKEKITRYDFSAGFSSIIRLTARVLMGKSINSKGKEYDLWGEKKAFGYSPTIGTEIATFTKNKLSPSAKVVYSFMVNEDVDDFKGEFNTYNAAKSLILPLNIRDAIGEENIKWEKKDFKGIPYEIPTGIKKGSDLDKNKTKYAIDRILSLYGVSILNYDE